MLSFSFSETAQQNMGTTGCDVETTTYQWYVKTTFFFIICGSLFPSECWCITTCNISNNFGKYASTATFCCEISETYMHMIITLYNDMCNILTVLTELPFDMFWINTGYSPPLNWKMGSHCLMSICMQSIWILPRSSLCPRSYPRLPLSAVSGRTQVLALT